MGDRKAVSGRAALHGDPNWWVRVAGAEEFGELGDAITAEAILKADDALDPLCRLLAGDEDPVVRGSAARSLGLIGRESAADARRSAVIEDGTALVWRDAVDARRTIWLSTVRDVGTESP